MSAGRIEESGRGRPRPRAILVRRAFYGDVAVSPPLSSFKGRLTGTWPSPPLSSGFLESASP